MLYQRLLVGEAAYEMKRAPRRRKKFAERLQDRFFVDASLERDEARRARRARDAFVAAEKAEAIKRKLRVDMGEIRKLQDELARKQGQHLEAEMTLMGAMMLQCAWRGRGARLKLGSLQELRALGLIGKYVMKYLNRKRQGRAACVFQMNARRWKAQRDRVSALVRRNAANVVQRAWRVFKSKAQMAQCKQLHDVASKCYHDACIFAKARIFQKMVLPSVAAGLVQQRWRRFQRRKMALQIRLRHHREAASTTAPSRMTPGHVANLSSVWERRRKSLLDRQQLATSSPDFSSSSNKQPPNPKSNANKLSQRAALHALTQVRRASKEYIERQQQQRNITSLVRAAALAQNKRIEEEVLVERDEKPGQETAKSERDAPSQRQKTSSSPTSNSSAAPATRANTRTKKKMTASVRSRRHHQHRHETDAPIVSKSANKASLAPQGAETSSASDTQCKKVSTATNGSLPTVKARSRMQSDTDGSIVTVKVAENAPTRTEAEVEMAEKTISAAGLSLEKDTDDDDYSFSFSAVSSAKGASSCNSSTSSDEYSSSASSSSDDDYTSVSSSESSSGSFGGSFVAAAGQFSYFDQSEIDKLEEERQRKLTESRLAKHEEEVNRKKPSPPSSSKSRPGNKFRVVRKKA